MGVDLFTDFERQKYLDNEKKFRNNISRKFKNIYRVSQKTWTFFEIGIIPLFIKESFQNFVW